MKRRNLFSTIWIVIISCICISLTGCRTGSFSTSYGKGDRAFISIISGKQYRGKTVQVFIDGKTFFDVKVINEKQSTEKHNGSLHEIHPGKRHVEIRYKDKILYSKTIFLSSQQTKIIRL